MSAPTWTHVAVAAVLVTVTVLHISGLLSRRRAQDTSIDSDLVHAAMGAAMAAMIVGVVAPSGGRYLAVAFAAPAVWMLCRSVHVFVMSGAGRALVPAELALGCAAMVYMLREVGRSAVSSMAAMPMASDSIPAASAMSLVLAMAVLSMSVLRRHAHRTRVRTACSMAMSTATVLMLTVL